MCTPRGKDTVRRPPPENQEERSPGKPALTVSWSWTSGLQNCEKMNYHHLSYLVWDSLLCQPFTFLLLPSKLLYMVKEALPGQTLICISCITLCHNPHPFSPPEISVLSVPLSVSDWPKSSNFESSELHSYTVSLNRVAIWLPSVSSTSGRLHERRNHTYFYYHCSFCLVCYFHILACNCCPNICRMNKQRRILVQLNQWRLAWSSEHRTRGVARDIATVKLPDAKNWLIGKDPDAGKD